MIYNESYKVNITCRVQSKRLNAEEDQSSQQLVGKLTIQMIADAMKSKLALN